MNRIDFSNPGGFPLTTNTLDLLQATYRLAVDALVRLGGDNYILSGCIENAGQISDGVIVHKGELLEFKGGAKRAYFVVREIKETGRFEDGFEREIYFVRWAEFGEGAGKTAWSSLKRLDNIQTITEELRTHTHTWTSITGKPTTFPPSTHNHPWSQVTGKPAYATRWAQWNEVTNKPSTFQPTTHNHPWSQIIGKPVHATRWPSWNEITDKPKFPEVLKVSSYYVGDVNGGDVNLLVSLQNLGTHSYVVVGSLRGVGKDWNADNDVIWQVRDLTATSFRLVLKELGKERQKLYFDYILIKR